MSWSRVRANIGSFKYSPRNGAIAMETTTQTASPQNAENMPSVQNTPNVRRPLASRAPWLRLLPEDGWFTLILLALSVYITVFSIESVTPPWAPGMQILTATTSLGL